MTPFGGAGIGWDEEDTSLKVNYIPYIVGNSASYNLDKGRTFKLMVNTITFSGQIF